MQVLWFIAQRQQWFIGRMIWSPLYFWWLDLWMYCMAVTWVTALPLQPQFNGKAAWHVHNWPCFLDVHRFHLKGHHFEYTVVSHNAFHSVWTGDFQDNSLSLHSIYYCTYCTLNIDIWFCVFSVEFIVQKYFTTVQTQSLFLDKGTGSLLGSTRQGNSLNRAPANHKAHTLIHYCEFNQYANPVCHSTIGVLGGNMHYMHTPQTQTSGGIWAWDQELLVI